MDYPSKIECIFSPDRNFRYVWAQLWEHPSRTPPLAVIGLNPSTADEQGPDPTVRRCLNFAKAWGYGGLIMLNLFAFRATNPEVMKMKKEPVGPENDLWLMLSSHKAGLTLAAWGVHGSYRGRAAEVEKLIPTLSCLGTTKGGFPRHPLYVKGDTKPVPYIHGSK